MAHLTSRIHSLSNETLANIFLSAIAEVFPDLLDSRIPNLSLQTELERVANSPLLSLSRVCSRWHGIALETPTLWSNIEIHGITEGALEQTLSLLKACLARSRDAPLSVLFRAKTFDRHSPHPRIFDLLAQHSHRWETIHFACSFKGLDTSALRGRLPRLTRLEMHSEVRVEHSKPVAPLDFLEVAPALTHLLIPAPLLPMKNVTTLCKQLRTFVCLVVPLHNELQSILHLVPQLPDAAGFHLTLDLDRFVVHEDRDLVLSLPPITASLATFGCRITARVRPHHLTLALSQLFGCLTLPSLEILFLIFEEYPKSTLAWSSGQHSSFLGLCDRSAFSRCLKTLTLEELAISEDQVLEILSALGALERLRVGDSPKDDPLPLVTDSFLRRMTSTVVPRLSYFACVSRRAFTPEIFLDFVMSRLPRVASAFVKSEFKVRLYLVPNCDSNRYLDSPAHATLRQLEVDHTHFSYKWDDFRPPRWSSS
ncbi:hypothetical protein FB45DRAFT_874294 [Roridomyces roridus]|uniref:F-box domain-containing protein n=1 Tax=Roridomyces roridus TaxID=1738132 RepID=A0AAD7B8T2_9AGAR|nr:hypothetical protein FB45DRAFT_874294 [Roridomyces roridus]